MTEIMGDNISDAVADVVSDAIAKLEVKRVKLLDDTIFGVCYSIMSENGLNTAYSINETFVINAIKKAIPAKPEMRAIEYLSMRFYCPSCGERLFRPRKSMAKNDSYCEKCGQRLKWED